MMVQVSSYSKDKRLASNLRNLLCLVSLHLIVTVQVSVFKFHYSR